MTHPYATGDYVKSLVHVGEALAVPEWGSHVLVRATRGGMERDAMGAYPLAVLSPDADLGAGLERLKAEGLVCVVLVLDERLRPDAQALDAAFDFVRPFKSHFLLDRGAGGFAYGKHHRYELKRALRQVEASEISLLDHLPAWEDLYGQLAERHGLAGLHAFPSTHHKTLARLPGLRAFGAFVEGRLVSAHLFVTHNGYGFSHLAASSQEGYETGAAYAVNDLAIAELSECDMINFGGGAGLSDDRADGLVRFKRGFSNSTAPSYLCGKVLDGSAYEMLSAGFGQNGFFPAYRGARAQEPADEHQG